MVDMAFNTHEFIKNLVKVGIDEEQAEVIAAGILRAHEVADLAKKSDLREVQMQMQADIREVQMQMQADMREVQVQMQAELHKMQIQTDARLDATDAKLDAIVAAIAEMKNEMKAMTKDMMAMKGDMLEMKGRVSAMPSTWQLIMMVVGIMAFTTALAFTLLRFGMPQ